MSTKLRFRRKKTENQPEQKSPFLNSGTKNRDHAENNTFFSRVSAPQTKMEIGKANDPSEKQADAVADHVVNTPGRGDGSMNLQKQSEEEDVQARFQRQEEEINGKQEIRKQEEEDTQAKLEVQPQEEEEPQAKPDIQSKEEEEMQTKMEVQRQKEKDNQTGQIQQKKKTPSASFEASVEQAKSGGFALPEDLRNEVEEKLNFNFAHVRIHTDREAEQLCNEINAQAFTTGWHIFFNKGKYQTETEAGKHLLVHELTHVVQQKGGNK